MGKQKKREKTGCICIILAAFVLCLSGILLLFNREQNKNKIRVVTVKGLDSDMENGQKCRIVEISDVGTFRPELILFFHDL